MRERPLSMNVDGGDLTLAGAVDEGSVSALRTLLAGLSDSGQAVSVDLRSVDYLPSFAIGVLAKARSRARARGLQFDLVAPDGCPAQRILQIAAIPYVDGQGEDETAEAGGAGGALSAEAAGPAGS